MPHIFTEFGSYTVGESMAHIYSVIGRKSAERQGNLVHDRFIFHHHLAGYLGYW